MVGGADHAFLLHPLDQPRGIVVADAQLPLQVGGRGLLALGEDDAETQMFRKAVQVVAESQKASTSYLQRQLRVGYNNAARLIERMEKDGLVGQPDHVGRREVLIDSDGHPI